MPSANSVLALALLAAAAAAQAGERVASVRLLVQESPLAGYRYAAADGLWPQLQVGDELDLSREPDNPHDTNAVRVAWRGHKLGYVPQRENVFETLTILENLEIGLTPRKDLPLGPRLQVK